MKSKNQSSKWLSTAVVFFGFFVMGFVDIVGVSTNYIKKDFALSSSVANTIPLMAFAWFLFFSIPVGVLMSRIGRKPTVLLSLMLTAVAMTIPFFTYTFLSVVVSFSLLGISNAILQVSLFPLIASMFSKNKTAGMVTMGTFFKAIASFVGPILVGFTSAYYNDWKITFILLSIASLLSVILLYFTKIDEISFENSPTNFRSVLSQLKKEYVLACFIIILLIVGFDVGINTSIPELLLTRAGLSLDRAALGISMYFAARTTGAFLGAFILLKIDPYTYLVYSLVGGIVAFLWMLFVSNLWMLLILIFIIGFCCANVFSIVFSLAMRREPSHVNDISALMIMGISGGALILPLQGIISDHVNFTSSLMVLLATLVLIFLLLFKIRVKPI